MNKNRLACFYFDDPPHISLKQYREKTQRLRALCEGHVFVFSYDSDLDDRSSSK